MTLSAVAARYQHAVSKVRRLEIGLLSAFLVFAGLIAAFVQIVDDLVEGETHAFDEAILLALRNRSDPSDPIGPLWVEIMFRDITSLGSHTVLGLVCVFAVGFLAMTRKRSAAVLLVTSVGGGMALSNLMKIGFERPRPDLVAHLVDVHTASFPSGHAMLSAVTYLTVGALLARVQPGRRLKVYILGAAVMITLLVGASRVYLGVHWPTDVLAGWSVGAAWAILCWMLALWLQRRGRVEGTAEAGELEVGRSYSQEAVPHRTDREEMP